MTYQVLARKWRPRDFASLVGQEHVVRALTHALERQRLHHAYLFTGTRGVGKTTLSRILAKALNCEAGITATPCGVCAACKAIDGGSFVDYIEMDAASNRGVEEMATLLDRAVYAPVDARFKVYMIDEVHMLTTHAFNAMLKTLEEPPAHVKFILATTDPQKIPVTVLSRCLQFNLKQMPAGHIVSHLEHVLQAETVAFEPQALRLLARAADGSMRDALSLTDQAIAYAAGAVSEEAVRAMLGAIDQHYLVDLLDAVAAADGAGVLALADEMAARSLSFATALQDLSSLLHRIAWAQAAPGSVLDEWPEAGDLRRLAALVSPEAVQLYYQIATIGRHELGLAPDEYAGFTMTLLRMLAFAPAGAAHDVAERQPTPAERLPTSVERLPAPAVRPVPAPVSASAGRARLERTSIVTDVPPPPIRDREAVPASVPRDELPAREPADEPAPRAARDDPPSARDEAPTARAGAPSARDEAPFASDDARPARAAAPARPVSPARAALDALRATGGTGRPRPGPEAVGQGRATVAPGAERTATRATGPAVSRDAASLPSDEPEPARPTGLPTGGRDSAGIHDSTAVPEAAGVPESSAVSLTPVGFDGDWPALAAALPLRGLARELACRSELIAADEGRLVLRVPVAQLAEQTQIDKLAGALAERLGRTLDISVETGRATYTAAAVDDARRSQRQHQAEQAIEQDAFVQSLIREFDATIVPGSIRPVTSSNAH